MIKDYFINFKEKTSDVKINLKLDTIEYKDNHQECNWQISIIDTGQNTMTGERLLKLDNLDDHTPFFFNIW